MALLESEPIPLGTKAPDFALPATDGTTCSLADFSDKKGLVVMFICNHCPYVIAVEDRLLDLGRDFVPRGIGFVAVMSNDAARYPADGPAKMAERVAEKAYPFPYLYDESQDVARAYGAVCTPDIFVFDRNLALAYHGRIDDSWKDASAATQHEMRDALDAIAEGRAPKTEQWPSMGCSLKWKE